MHPDYRRAQRQLGEIQASLTLANGVRKALPSIKELENAVRALIKAKAVLFNRVAELERQ